MGNNYFRPMNKFSYIALCLIVPLVWGVVSARVFDALQARRRPPVSPTDETAYGYEI